MNQSLDLPGVARCQSAVGSTNPSPTRRPDSMNGLRPLVPNGGGKRKADVEVRAPRFAPGNVVARTATAFVNQSRRAAPEQLRRLGYSSVEFSTPGGATCITLHIGEHGDGASKFNDKTGNIATVLLAGGDPALSELFVFDTARSRIGATRLVATTSFDHPESVVSKVARLIPAAGQVAGQVAGLPAVGRLIGPLFTGTVKAARKVRRTTSNPKIREAKLTVKMPADGACFMRTGRKDRPFEPSDEDGESHSERRHALAGIVDTATQDVVSALDEFSLTDRFAALRRFEQLRTKRDVQVAAETVGLQSLMAFDKDETAPYALRLLCLDDGPAHFVRRVATGERP